MVDPIYSVRIRQIGQRTANASTEGRLAGGFGLGSQNQNSGFLQAAAEQQDPAPISVKFAQFCAGFMTAFCCRCLHEPEVALILMSVLRLQTALPAEQLKNCNAPVPELLA